MVHHRSRLAWCYAGNVSFGAGLFFHAFLYNFYLQGLGLGPGIMGQAAGMLTAGGVIALVPAGWLVDRMGSRFALHAAVVVATLGLVAGAVASSPFSIAIAAGITGAATAAWRIATAPALLELGGSIDRARLFGWNVALLVGSGGLWYALAGALPRWLEPVAGTRHTSIRWTLVAGGLMTAVALFCYALARLPQRPKQPVAGPPSSPKPKLTALLALPRPAMAIMVTATVWMTAGALLASFYNIYFTQRFGIGIDRLGLIFGLTHLLTALVVLASGEVATRAGPRRTLAGWFVAFPLLVMLLGMANAATPALAAYFLLGLVSPSSNPLFDQLLFERVPVERRGLASSWRSAATESSGAVGAWIGGLIIALTSFTTLFAVAALLGVVGAVAVMWATSIASGRNLEAAPYEHPRPLREDRG